MKKIVIISLFAAICGVANATSINVPSSLTGSDALSGQDAYSWGLTLSVPSGQTVTSASITFNNVTLTVANSSGTGYLYTDIIKSTKTGVGVYSDNDASGDFFQTVVSKANLVSLGTQFFKSVGTTLSWTYTFNTSELASLNSFLTGGVFDIGIDPDCHYNVGGIVFNYTTDTTHVNVPDTATTIYLLGLGLVGIELARRKFATAK